MVKPSKAISRLRSIAFSKRCVLCQFKHHHHLAICEICFQRLPRLASVCSGCALPLSGNSITRCRTCLSQPPTADYVFIHHPYVEPLRSLIHHFKFHQGLFLTSLLASLMHDPTTPLPELFIPVPLHPRRIQTRGFNQTILLAKQLSKQLQIPYETATCKKIKHTSAQASLAASQRQANLLDSFSVSPIPYQHIALIDDVYTTGATVNTLAALFKQQGVARVDVWCIARTLVTDP